MRIVPDNSHCFKHACSHPMDEACPYCARDALVKRIVQDRVNSQWPNRNRVTMPELMRELAKRGMR